MFAKAHPLPPTTARRLLAVLLSLSLYGCAAGPDFVPPTADAPEDWSSWRSVDASLRALPNEGDSLSSQLPADWWLIFDDPVLNDLQQRALRASPDLQTAALHFAQARVQRSTVAAQRGADVGLNANIGRQRQSEFGAATRMLDLISDDRSLAELLSEPFNLYQSGFDASWELDLWGRVARSIEAADAGIAQQAALLDMARLSIVSEVARSYFQLRTAQQKIHLAQQAEQALQEQLLLLQARVDGGMEDHFALDRQQADLASVRATLPMLLLEEGNSLNQLSLLLGERPGALRDSLASQTSQPGESATNDSRTNARQASLPDLSLGLPSEVALRRPDIRAAEARLHRAIAEIGVAEASLYPSIRLGARFGFESYLSGEFADWGSRSWSLGPVLNLPLFDHGRRKSVVQLRQLEQQEAAVAYHKTVLQAWQEIDNALSAYRAAQEQHIHLQAKLAASEDAYNIAQARYDGGMVNFMAVLDSRRGYLQAQRELAENEGQLRSLFVAVNKAVGNVPENISAPGV